MKRKKLVDAGARVLDVGGESTRPGARAVTAAQEIARTRPLLEALAKRFTTPLSIDTRKRAVAQAALDAGARIVNDVSGGRAEPALLETVARAGAYIVLGHLRGEPATMQRRVAFHDAVREVGDELCEAVRAAKAAGIAASRIAVDPGIGFGKRLEHNLALVANLDALRARVGHPLWVGVSRKSFLGELSGRASDQRDFESHIAGGIALFAGADALRVHDVVGARRALCIAHALRAARAPSAGSAA